MPGRQYRALIIRARYWGIWEPKISIAIYLSPFSMRSGTLRVSAAVEDGRRVPLPLPLAAAPTATTTPTIGALIIRIGFGSPLSYSYHKEPTKIV